MKNKIRKYLHRNSNILSEATILLFGGTGEIGVALLEELVYLNAKIVLAVRNVEKAKKIVENIKRKYINSKIDIIAFDLTSINDIIELDIKLNKYKFTNIIINSAIDTKDYDLSFLVNCYMPYQIIIKFKGVNTIVTSSISYKKNDANDYYAIHKRKLMQLCYLLNNEGYNINLVHPGIVYTQLFCKRNKKFSFTFPLLRLFMPSVFKAALNIIYAINKKIDSKFWIGPRGILNTFGYPSIRKLKKELYEESNITNTKNEMVEMEKKYGL